MPSKKTGNWILAAAILASSTAFLLGAAVNIALPSIQTYFGSDISGIEWVVNAQLLFLSTLLMIGGSLGDYYGRKRIFVLGISIVTLACILAGFAPSLGWLIFFQSVQGIGSAMMVSQSLAIINASFPQSERGKIIGLWAGISGAIAALGPWLGGWLVESFSWRAAFLLSAPIGAGALIIALIFVPEGAKSIVRKLDWIGTLLVFLGLMGLAYGLISSQLSGWTETSVLAGLIGGTLFLAIFVFVELRKRDPLIPRQVFENSMVAGANMVTLLLYFALNGVLFFLVLDLQQIQGYSPAMAGLALLVPTILIGIFSGPAGSLGDKIGPRLQMILGPGLVAGGTALLGFGGNEPGFIKHFLPGLLLVGSGMALVIAPLTKSALLVKPEFSGAASGLNNAVARFAALMAIALLGAMMLSSFSSELSRSADASTLSIPQQKQIINQSNKLGGIVIPATFDSASKEMAQRIIKESFVVSFRWAMGICAVLAAAGSMAAAIMIHNLQGKPAETTAKG